MVYVYAKQSELNKYIGAELSVEEIKETLVDMGMDIKGEEGEKDPELKIEITAEKLDLVSAVGIGRAIKFYRGLAKKLPVYDLPDSGLKLFVKKSSEGVRPRTVCAVLRDVPMDQEFLDEIIKVQEKIHDSFGRGRKKGAIGIYPMDKIKFPISYGAERPEDIVFRPLEFDREINGREILQIHDTGKKYAHLLDHYDLYPVFRDDDAKVLSMPPIINSHDTGRVETNHRDLFIECSGYNLSLLDNILKVMVSSFIEMGARAESMEVVYEGTDEVYRLNLEPLVDEIELTMINKLIGTDIASDEISDYMMKMMYEVENVQQGKIKFKIPAFRSDVWHDVDVADDVARAYGYNNIVPTFPNVSSVGTHLKFSLYKEMFSEALVRLGFLETYTYMLSSTVEQFDKMGIDGSKLEYIKLKDTADQGLNMVRTMILPESLVTLNINRRNKYPQKVFENGFTIQVDDSSDVGAVNRTHLSVSIADPRANYTDIKGVLDTLLKLMGIDFEIEESVREYLIEGRRAEIVVRGESIGFIGEVAPKVLDSFGLLVPVASLEIDLDRLYELTEM